MAEYFKINGREFNDDKIYDYLKWGGFPLRFEFQDEASVKKYVKGLYESIVTRDILSPKMMKNQQLFRDISLYVLANAGKEFSAENIAEYYRHFLKDDFTKSISFS